MSAGMRMARDVYGYLVNDQHWYADVLLRRVMAAHAGVPPWLYADLAPESTASIDTRPYCGHPLDKLLPRETAYDVLNKIWWCECGELVTELDIVKRR